MLPRSARSISMAEVDRLLPPPSRRHRDGGTIVVIADDEAQVTRLAIDVSPWAEARVVTVLAPAGSQVHDRLAALSEVALVIDVRRSTGPGQLEAFRQGFWHLGPRDAWVALRSPEESGQVDGSEPLPALAHRLHTGTAVKELPREQRPAARSVSRVRITPELAVLVKRRRRHLLTLREHELALLDTREPALKVTRLAQLAPGVLDATGLSHDYGHPPTLRVPDALPYPEHSVRRYDGLLHLPRAGLVQHHRTVLPDSFRWHLAAQPESQGLRRVDERFGVLEEEPPEEHLDGSYYLLLYSNPGHFGHLMTEAVSKLWGWWPAKAADPTLKILCRLHPQPERAQTPETRLESTLLPAFGIASEDITWVAGPVSVERLSASTPMWHNAEPFYVHPRITETWTRLRTGLIGAETPADGPRIFVTRRGLERRPCRNVDEVEELFARAGFTIVSPEERPLADQARLFASARVIAGFGGAGMFNLVFAHRVEHVIVLDQWAYQARNEHLFAVAHGAELHAFWSPPDVDHPAGGSSYRAHQSAWTFDRETLERPLRDLLERLGD